MPLPQPDLNVRLATLEGALAKETADRIAFQAWSSQLSQVIAEQDQQIAQLLAERDVDVVVDVPDEPMEPEDPKVTHEQVEGQQT